GDVFGVLDSQLAIIFDEHRPAGGFEEQDWSVASFAKATAAKGVLEREDCDVLLGEFCRGVQISLTKCRAAATPPVFYERNFESECLEYFSRGTAVVRLLITHKIIAQGDAAAPFFV